LFAGALLVVGTLVLGGSLLCAATCAIGFSVFLVLAYYGLQVCQTMVQNIAFRLGLLNVDEDLEKEE